MIIGDLSVSGISVAPVITHNFAVISLQLQTMDIHWWIGFIVLYLAHDTLSRRSQKVREDCGYFPKCDSRALSQALCIYFLLFSF